MTQDRPSRGALAILRGDLRALHAQQSQPFGWLVNHIGERLEHLGDGEFRVMICPPLTLLHPPSGDPATPAEFIHAFYLRRLWKDRTALAKLRLVLALAVFSIPMNLAAILWETAVNGRAIGRRTGKPLAGLMREQADMAFRHNIMAPWYFQFDLHDDAKRARAGEYLHRFELKGGCYRFLKRRRGRAVAGALGKKEVFDGICRANGLPALPLVAVVAGGHWRWAEARPALPAADLFVKPRSGHGGDGARRWDHDGRSRWRNGDLVLDAAGLTAHLAERSRQATLIVQERVVPHPAIADLSNGALPTVRVLTCLNEQGVPEPVAAGFRMAIGRNTVVDNFHAGGIVANVELATGKLGRATDTGLTPDIAWVDTHPDTGAPIIGRVLPLWADVLALACRAHGMFGNWVVIGWDIAIGAAGPCLVEGNGGPDTDIHQRAAGEPLGAGRLGELLAFHLGFRGPAGERVGPDGGQA